MKNRIFLSLGFLFLLIFQVQVQAQIANDNQDFLKSFNLRKSKLSKLPPKQIQETPYCAQIEVLIDQAPWADKTNPTLKADRIVVSKARRKLYLLSQGQLLGEYFVAFGFGFIEGAKSQVSDGRTPEGIYKVDFKKKKSSYTKALHVSYPNEDDKRFARQYHVDPGGDIMIHGFPKDAIDGLDPVKIPLIHPNVDWTQGCMAVTNDEIEEIYKLVDEGVTIEICSL